MTQDEFSTTLSTALTHLGVASEPARIATLRRHFDLLLEANARFNLTRVTHPGEAAVRLYADSAAVMVWAGDRVSRAWRVLDVGSGAGFPAVPLAVLAPKWRVTALEATGKKATFIDHAARSLGIDNLEAVHAHSDHWSSPTQFDLVTFKAVSRLDVCLTTAAKLVAPGGHVLMFKTLDLPGEEVAAGQQAATRLGFNSLDPLAYELPGPEVPAEFAVHVYGRPGSPRSEPRARARGPAR